MGGRSTAIRMKNGGVWLLASTPLSPETKAKLDELGPVQCVMTLMGGRALMAAASLIRYIVGADAVHHLFIGMWAERVIVERIYLNVLQVTTRRRTQMQS